jgi:probable HAF family extracellular repeat protein
MIDAGTLGGTNGYPSGLNGKGQMAGHSNLKGDANFRAFFWSPGSHIKDLGTLGGDNSEANWINAAGHVVGWANTSGGFLRDAFLWRNGKMQDLGLLPGDSCSVAYWINSLDQVVGRAGDCGQDTDFWPDSFLWQNGHMYNLNSLITPPKSGLRVARVTTIDNRGDIAALGILPSGHIHAVLLVPSK